MTDVASGKDGAWLRLAAAGIGWIPGIGDALKGGARVGTRLGTEVIEEGAERVVKEVAEEVVEEGTERVVKEGAEDGVETVAEETAQAASKVKRTLPSREPDLNAVPGGRRTKIQPNDKDPGNDQPQRQGPRRDPRSHPRERVGGRACKERL